MIYDILFISPLPSFYKVNLFNSISKSKSIFVIFLASGTSEIRSSDFVSSNNDFDFPHTFLSLSTLQDRFLLKSLLKLLFLRFKLRSKVFVASGWRFAEDWLGIFIFGYHCRSSIIESSILDSSRSLLRNFFKRVFLSRLDLCLVPGSFHSHLLRSLGFHREVVLTYGVGFINKTTISPSRGSVIIPPNSFLFVGRLVEEKNLLSLISAFNACPEFQLFIIGDGPLYSSLYEQSRSNISFLGHRSNEFVRSALHDCGCLILPSVYEPWGLVVEEALYQGKLCIVSEACGISSLSQFCRNLYVCSTSSESIESYLKIIFGKLPLPSCLSEDSKVFIDSKDQKQLESYLSLPSFNS